MSYFPENWPDFVARLWNREALVIPNAIDPPLATSEEIFTALQSLARQFRDDADRPSDRPPNELPPEQEERRSDVKLLFDNMRLLGAEVDPLLPDSTDTTLDQYGERLCRAAGRRDVMLYVTGLQRFTPQIWRRACEFLTPLYESVGMPAGYADLELFMGRYKGTPGGVHRDRGTNFHFVISGHKKMYVWPRREFWSTSRSESESFHPGRASEFQPLQWRQALGDGLSLEAGPRDVFHWAIDHWHVGDSPEFSVSLNIALYLHGSPWKLIESSLSRELASADISSYPFRPRMDLWHAQDLPADVSSIFDRLVSAASAERRAFLAAQEWLRKTTSFGFGTVPPLEASPPVRPGDSLRKVGLMPILYRRVGHRLLYGANGHVADTADSPWVARLLEEINSSPAGCVQSVLLRSASEDVSRALEMVQGLVRMRAVEVLRTDPARDSNSP